MVQSCSVINVCFIFKTSSVLPSFLCKVRATLGGKAGSILAVRVGESEHLRPVNALGDLDQLLRTRDAVRR